MCLNSAIDNTQLNRFVEQGMPQKILKTVQYTIKKRAEGIRRAEELKQTVEEPNKIKKNFSRVEEETCLRANKTNANEAFQIPKMCGRFLEAQQNNNANSEVPLSSTSLVAHKIRENYHFDFLAICNLLARQIVQRFNSFIVSLQQHKLCIVLTKTTQPAHLVALCILGVVLLIVGPDLIDNRSKNFSVLTATKKTTTLYMELTSRNQNPNTKGQTENNEKKMFKKEMAMILYLGTFATHFGSQIWMTFVSGLSLYFSLPRHIFGQCQQILFPKYFALNAVLSLTLLVLFVKYFAHIWTTSNCIQLAALSLSAAIELTVRLYLAPPMLQLMHEKYKIENAIGSGKEIGKIVKGDLEQCPHYQRIHKMFRRIHMIIAIGNIIVLLATFLHLYFLASKIQIH